MKALASLKTHPCSDVLIDIVTGETHISSAGYPYICDGCFQLFIGQVCHLFEDGETVLSWLNILEKELPNFDTASDERESVNRAIKVLRTIVFTAGITAPPDLWVLRQVLSAHKQLGTLDWLLSGQVLKPPFFAKMQGLNVKQLEIDLHFLHARGYLTTTATGFLITKNKHIDDVFRMVQPLKKNYQTNMVGKITDWFSGKSRDNSSRRFLQDWLDFAAKPRPTGSWIANYYQIELGYRLVLLVLGLRVNELTGQLKEGVSFAAHVPGIFPELNRIFDSAYLIKNNRVTQLGARVFARGPGPFGIIAAYHPYLTNLPVILTSTWVQSWVCRGENVAASQDANRKTFQAANSALDAFCKESKFQYDVFIEHAVGQGEATRQRFERSGEKTIRYFGADLEDAAIEQAIEQQKKGDLPTNMQFIRCADIGEPQRVIGYLQKQNLSSESAVMMVGNGFHEIRRQTNEKMIAVFRQYQEAGIVLIFTEESALNDDDLLNSAWNTYHAGFRYVHEISGQGLRPSEDEGAEPATWSWHKCATHGGYVILEKFSHRTRTIYPYKKSRRKNPSISVTYFCIPQKLAVRLSGDIT